MPITTVEHRVRSRAVLILLSAIVFAPVGTFAQKALPTSDKPTTAAPSKSEVERKNEADTAPLVLNPFVVATAQDTGYQATSTLAGTRLNTPVKDIGASVSIYTKDFLNDIGATNASDLLIYATGMEAGGPGGNFSNATNDINNPQIVGDGSRNAPQAQSRTRGLSSPNATRGYFTSDYGFDSYNTDSVTVIRGANAILFGVGSPAGVVESTPARADLNRNKNKIEFRYGDNDAMRFSVDFNRVLIPKKLAFRVAALDDQERYDQRPSFDNKRRLYGTLSYEPFPTTAFRAQYEAGNTRANRPFSIPPFNSISDQWYAAGKPTWDWNFYDDPARNPLASTQDAGTFFSASPTSRLIGQAQIFGGFVVPLDSSTASAPSRGFRSTLPSGNGLNSVRAALFEPLVNRDAVFDSIAFYETFNVSEIPPGYYADNRRPAGLKTQGFTNFDAFNWKDRQIDETGRQRDDFHTATFTFEQRGWEDRLGVEAAYYVQRYDTRNRNSFFGTQGNANHVRIDPNVYLPDGRLNPNVGRPYASMASVSYGNNFTDRHTLRLTPFVRYDFKDVSPTLGKWLGRHTLTGLYERAVVDGLSFTTRLAADGAAADPLGIINTFNRRPNVLVYMGPSILGTGSLKLDAIKTSAIRPGLVTPTSWWDAPLTQPATVQATANTVPITLKEIYESGSRFRETISSQAAVLQSYWLDNLLVTTGGIRRDESVRRSPRANFTYDPLLPDSIVKGFEDYNVYSFPRVQTGKEVKSYSGVIRWPQKIVRLPWGIDASAFLNVSSNFTPLGSRINYVGDFLKSPQGKTREYGLNLSLFNDRLNLRYNHFDTSVVGQSYNVPFNYTNAIVQMTQFWISENNDNRNPTINRRPDIEKIYSVLPSNFRTLYGFTYTGSPATNDQQQNVVGVSGVTDTTDFNAKGHEVDIVFNPTKQWRLLANFASGETVQTNIAPTAKRIIAAMRPVWDELKDKPRANYPTGFDITQPLPASVETVGQFVSSTVYIPFATMLATEGSAAAEQRKYRANLVSNYTFGRDTWLKGWNITTGVRWQSKLGIGYPSKYNPDGSVDLGIKNPFYAPAETNIDVTVGYGRKFWNNKIDWRASLQVRNAYSSGNDLIPITVQPDGSVASYRVAPEQRFYLTNSFSF
jgi:outer membrane receptor protein involved in Fe transport